MTIRPFAFLAALVVATAAFAADTAPASAPARISVKDTDALKAAVGKGVVVFGEISRVSPSPSGSLTFINFKDLQRGDFSAIIKKENKEALDKAFDGDVAKAIKGKSVELSGTVIDYQGRPEIDITKPEQLKIVAKTEPAASAPAATVPAKN
jgi:DNA/RNA endonuclease YhcR with UshA esterase domain